MPVLHSTVHEAPDEMSSCSCSNSEENSRQGRAVRLFGVNLLDGATSSSSMMRKSVSLGNLQHYAGVGSSNNLANLDATTDGYLSDGMVHAGNNSSRARRKGVPWTEDEHRLFLLGLQKLGKGDWRGISKAFVTTRTPTQVASHAQKYFIRQSNISKRKRRSSLFDISHDSTAFPAADYTSKGTVSFVDLELAQHERIGGGATLEKIVEENGSDQEVRCKVEVQESVETTRPVLWLGLNPPQPAEATAATGSGAPSNIVKPVASLSTGPVMIDDGRIEDGSAGGNLKIEPSLLSLKLEEPLRHSAFRYGAKAPIQCT